MATLLPNGKQAYATNAGEPLVGGKLYTYAAGTSTPLPTYAEAAGVNPNTNPVILDSRGEAVIFWKGAYKVTLKDANDNLIWTIDNIISLDFSAPGGSATVGFIQAGPGAVATTVQVELRREIWVEQFGAVAGGDATANVAAFRAAFTQAIAVGGCVVRAGPGTFNLASAALGLAGISVGAGVSFRGQEREATRLVVTGGTACNIFAALNVGNIGFYDFSMYGNSVSGGEGQGEAIRVLQLVTTTAPIYNIAFENLYLENFKAPFWLVVENQAGGASGPDIGNNSPNTINNVSFKRIRAKALNGNSIDPTAVTTLAHVIKILGYSGFINDWTIEDLYAECSYIKGGIAVFHKTTSGRITKPVIKDAGVNGAIDDAGAYAILLYDTFAVSGGCYVDGPRLENPRSCGIYVAGANDITISDPYIYGQTDTFAGTLPKGAVALNGAARCLVRGGFLSGNYFGLMSSGIQPDANIIFDGVRVLGGQYSCYIVYSPFFLSAGSGVRSVNCVYDSASVGVAVFNASTALTRIDDVVIHNCFVRAQTYAIDFYANGLPSTATGYIVSDCTVISGAGQALRANAQTGTITVRDSKFEGQTVNTDHIQLTGCTSITVCNVESKGVGGGDRGYQLNGSSGSLWNLTAPGCAVVAQAGSFGLAIPTHSGPRGQLVQNLAPVALGVSYWEALDSVGTWASVKFS